MLIQVVHSHPLEDSYNHALFKSIVETLGQRHEVIATDLYREQFSPVMTEAERRSYYEAGRWHHLLLSALVVFDACHAQGLFRSRLGARNCVYP